jgi:hypothetical protein
MKKILFVSDYTNRSVECFNTSLCDVVFSAFSEIGMDAYIISTDTIEYARDKYFDATIFAVRPENLNKKCKDILNKKNQYGKMILWNLEPFGDGYGKFYRRINSIYETLEKNIIDDLWVYDDLQKEKYKNAVWCPIAYNKRLNRAHKVLKTKKRRVIFVGHGTGYRGLFFNVLKNRLNEFEKTRIIIDKYICSTRSSGKSRLSEFKLGLDISGNQSCIDSPRWHRIMMYSACGVLVLSQSDLSRWGFVDGQHYVKCGSARDYAEKIDYYLNNDDKRKRIVNNMLDKIKEDFNMAKIFKENLGKYNVKSR